MPDLPRYRVLAGVPHPARVAGVLLALLLLLLGATAAHARAATVSAYPEPGSKAASPRTQLSFRGATKSDLKHLSVKGSRSGTHRGTLREHSDGKGVSFVPRHRFRSDETVTVRTRLPVVGATKGTYRLKIARFVSIKPAAGTKRGSKKGILSFRSRPDLHPPKVSILTAPRDVAPGYTFLAPKLGAGQGGPMILDTRGRMVYFQPTKGKNTSGDFRVQTYDGKPVLTYWEGTSSAGEGHGTGVLLDQHYRQVARVRGGNGYSLDLHEFQLTPRGTALVTIYQPVRWSLASIGGSRTSSAVDSIVQEIDVKTGLVVFEWHSLDHVALKDTVIPHPSKNTTRFDYFHLNSVTDAGPNALVISSRRTSAIYKLSRASGKIIWRLGGKHSDFKLGKGVKFALQHDARVQDNGDLRLFDNSDDHLGNRSRALTLHLDTKKDTASVVSDVRHPSEKIFAATQGDAQLLPGGGLLIGWGSQGRISEISADGKLQFDAQLPAGYDSYRAFKMPWAGIPDSRPRVAAKALQGGGAQVWVSWNGATEVKHWEVLATDAAGHTTVAGRSAWWDFETGIKIGGAPVKVAVRALDVHQQPLGTSATVEVTK